MRIKEYFEETKTELLSKVTWPTWPELQSSALIVMVASLIIALIVYLMDYTFSNLMELFYNTF